MGAVNNDIGAAAHSLSSQHGIIFSAAREIGKCEIALSSSLSHLVPREPFSSPEEGRKERRGDVSKDREHSMSLQEQVFLSMQRRVGQFCWFIVGDFLPIRGETFR